MSDTKRTSVSLNEEQHQFVKQNEVSFSQLLQDAIDRRMEGDDEEARIRSQLADLREQKSELEDQQARIEAQIQTLEGRLENIENGQTEAIDNLVSKFNNTKEGGDADQIRFEFIADNIELDATPEDIQSCWNYAIETVKEDENAQFSTEFVPEEPLNDSEEKKIREFAKKEILD